MSAEADFYLKMGLVLITSGIIMYVMMKLQDRKQKEAEEAFRRLLKSKGMNPDLEE